jgi:glycogen operon protein
VTKEHFTIGRLTLPGYPLPLGANISGKGVQFSIFSRNARSVTLELFESSEPDSRCDSIPFDPQINKTGDIWHIWVEGIKEGQLYGYRVDGDYNPEQGHRFNKFKLLIDPYTRAVSGNFNWNLSDARGYEQGHVNGEHILSTKDSGPGAPKCIVINHDFDWFDRPLKRHFNETVIYELHVRGFSCHPSSPASAKGTYKGLSEMIPYLKDLGVTAVELMPIQEFDESENINVNPSTGEKLRNYWGYSTITFFAPRGRYAASGTLGEQVYEFKEMVRDFHNAGIEVILDVVFNHTAEGDHTGPTLCFRGIDNSIYYMLEDNKRYYKNYSGCGNTFNCNNPIVRSFIIDCLKFWVIEMHIDGFRFDLASILGRDEQGNILANPPLLETISEDPILRNTKIIAEAWDAAGAFQVGNFPGRWAEWNSKFRDDVRKYWRGDDNTVGYLATRLTGSADLYEASRSPLHSINFITCHDGFTLNDLVSYSRKHNEANGENNRDGENNNISYNWGYEGPDETPLVARTRNRMIKNFIATLFVSQGTPMILAGDEFRRTQQGNNNAYCQDNGISWIDWTRMDTYGEILRFTKYMISFRKRHSILRRKRFLKGSIENYFNSPDLTWHGTEPGKPDWTPESRVLAFVLSGEYGRKEAGSADKDIYVAMNSSLYNKRIVIPESPSGFPWKRIVDTSMPSPDDFIDETDAQNIADSTYILKRQSLIVLVAGK